jgi:hypothetical protein
MSTITAWAPPCPPPCAPPVAQGAGCARTPLGTLTSLLRGVVAVGVWAARAGGCPDPGNFALVSPWTALGRAQSFASPVRARCRGGWPVDAGLPSLLVGRGKAQRTKQGLLLSKLQPGSKNCMATASSRAPSPCA